MIGIKAVEEATPGREEAPQAAVRASVDDRGPTGKGEGVGRTRIRRN